MKFAVFIYLLLISCDVHSKAESTEHPQEEAAEATKDTDEIELPKADFLQQKLNSMMQNTANWLDTVGEEPSKVKREVASAKGYLQLSWLPRTSDLADADANFKVALHLPKWNERLALIIDNDDEDEMLLDYETNYTKETDSVNVALQYIKEFNQQQKLRNRLGFSRGQLYLRSEMKFSWQLKKVNFNVQPRIDYFIKDGWGPAIKGVATYPLENSYFSLSASWQKVQAESSSRRKVGLYHVLPSGPNQLLVTGMQYVRNNNSDDISNDSYNVSMRYRNLWYKSWLFFEVEPFIEFSEVNDYDRQVGIALSMISYYGD